MKLSELFLNRFLYKDTSQNMETKSSEFLSADSTPDTPTPLAAGGAAQDINTSNVLINGAQLEPGTYPTTTLDVSNWGWGQTCAFTSDDADTVSWGAGTFTSASGDTYSISAGTTGNMAAKTYIYLSLLDSETEYQITTTSSDSVGLGKVLIAVAENASDSATYNLSQASQIVGDNILANTIDASKITAGQLVVGTNVGIGTAFPTASAGDLAYEDLVGLALLDNTVIVGGYIKTSLLTADNITTGTLTGITITGNTINGGTLNINDKSIIDSDGEATFIGVSTLNMKAYTNFESIDRFLVTGDGGGVIGNQGLTVYPGAVATQYARVLWNATNYILHNEPTFTCVLNINNKGTLDGQFAVGLGYIPVDGNGFTELDSDNFCGFYLKKASGTVTLQAFQEKDDDTYQASGDLTTVTTGDTLELFIKVKATGVTYYYRKNGGTLESTTLTTGNPAGKLESYIMFANSNKGNASDFQVIVNCASYEH